MSTHNENVDDEQPARRERRALKDVSNRTVINGSKGAKAVKAQKRTIKPIANSNLRREVANVKVAKSTKTSTADESKSKPDPPVDTTVAYQYRGPPHDIDDADADDPLCVTSYVQDMYKHYRVKEHETSVLTDYMENQPNITSVHRSVLVDWLVEVHLQFKMVPETLYLTVNLIDRYLAKTEVQKPKLQLVGITSLLIASKYEEYQPPELRDLVHLCDKAYTKSEILDMEEVILKKLDYRITIPSAHAFLVRFLKASHADKKIVQLSCYILDGTLQSYNLLDYLPSQIAAAAVLIARKNAGRNAWSPTLLKYTEYREEDILPIARKVLRAKATASTTLRAVNDKYSKSKYGRVATIKLSLDFLSCLEF